MGLERQPVRSFIGVPEGYKKTVLKEAKSLVREVNPCSANCNKVEQGTRDRWKEITGLEPQDSRFTLIVPIHNEERYLSAALSSIAVSDIPRSAYVNFVFVTNNCTDASPQIVDQFMRDFGEVRSGRFEDEDIEDLSDPGLDSGYTYSANGNLTFTHIDTSTPSQSNAFNLGNTLSRSRGDKIAISVDANNFLEPDTIAHLYASAHRMIEEERDGIALITGVCKTEMLPRRLLPIVKRIKDGAADQTKQPELRVTGCLMAWDSEFVDEIGGIPRVALVDYATGVLVRLNGRRVEKDEESIIWGYEPNNFPDRLNQYRRAARGRMQVRAMSPEASEVVSRDYPHLTGGRLDRLKANLKLMTQSPRRSPYMFVKYLMHEYGIAAGKREFEREPLKDSWDPIQSTK